VSSLLLISLNIDTLLGEITLFWRRRKLDEITKGDRWGECLRGDLIMNDGVAEKRKKLAMGVLMWVSLVDRPF